MKTWYNLEQCKVPANQFRLTLCVERTPLQYDGEGSVLYDSYSVAEGSFASLLLYARQRCTTHVK